MDRRTKSEIRDQRSEIRGQRSEVRGAQGTVRTWYTLVVQDIVYTSATFCWLFSLVSSAFCGRISARKKLALEASIWPSKSRPNQTLSASLTLCTPTFQPAKLVLRK